MREGRDLRASRLRIPVMTVIRLGPFLLLLALLWPGNAGAGGLAVRAPADLGADDCAQGKPALIIGPVSPEPVPPTVVGCIGRGDRRALVAVTRDNSVPGDQELCFFVVPAAEVVSNWSCTRPEAVIQWPPTSPAPNTMRIKPRLALRLGAPGAFTFTPDAGRRAHLVLTGIELLVATLSGVFEAMTQKPEDRFLAFSRIPVDPPGGGVGNLMSRHGVVGRSAEGRRIHLRQYGDPAVDGELLVFGCIHGDECAAREIQPTTGCPFYDADIYKVANLNPDGYALGTRLNGRGVDLNRNFPTGWKPIGRRGSPQFSGPRPFSEPESILAARLIRHLKPEATIWFHQQPGPAVVRAWGQSIPLARRYARLAGLPFRRMPWLAGTAPNWQNNTFPGTASFVVELPDGGVSERRIRSLGEGVARLGREIGRRAS